MNNNIHPDNMEEYISEIPPCSNHITTIDGRILFMDLCEEKIKQNQLTQEVLDLITSYVYCVELMEYARQQTIKHGFALADNKPNPWIEVENVCGNRMFDYCEALGLFPSDRKNNAKGEHGC